MTSATTSRPAVGSGGPGEHGLVVGVVVDSHRTVAPAPTLVDGTPGPRPVRAHTEESGARD